MFDEPASHTSECLSLKYSKCICQGIIYKKIINKKKIKWKLYQNGKKKKYKHSAPTSSVWNLFPISWTQNFSNSLSILIIQVRK